MTRRYRHSAPWSSLDDAWSRLRLTPPLDTITLRDGRQHNYRWLPARDPILITCFTARGRLQRGPPKISIRTCGYYRGHSALRCCTGLPWRSMLTPTRIAGTEQATQPAP